MFVQLFYYFFYFSRILSHLDQQTDSKEDIGVSVIIAAKNEASNISNLKGILKQKHKLFEVIVVNNHSTDDTLKQLETINSPNLKVYDYQEKEGKKAALDFGIQQAKYNLLLLTDADCIISSENWLQKMANNFSESKQIVIGFAGFVPEKSALNHLIRYENLLNFIQIFSFALAGKAYAAVGRNMGYTQEIYRKSTALKNEHLILSGDDDLLVNEMATEDNVAICLSAEAQTFTKTATNWKTYFYQRRRQLQAGNFYKKADFFRLTIFGATNLFYYIFFMLLLFLNYNNTLIIGIFAIKQLLQYMLFSRIGKKLELKSNLILLPLLESIYLVVIGIIGVSTLIFKVDKWK